MTYSWGLRWDERRDRRKRNFCRESTKGCAVVERGLFRRLVEQRRAMKFKTLFVLFCGESSLSGFWSVLYGNMSLRVSSCLLSWLRTLHVASFIWRQIGSGRVKSSSFFRSGRLSHTTGRYFKVPLCRLKWSDQPRPCINPHLLFMFTFHSSAEAHLQHISRTLPTMSKLNTISS